MLAERIRRQFRRIARPELEAGFSIEIYRPQSVALVVCADAGHVDGQVFEGVACWSGTALFDQADDDPVVRIDAATTLVKRSIEERGELEQNGGELISTFSVPPGTGAWAVLHDDVFSEGLEHRAVIAFFGRIQESLNGSTVQFRHLLTSLCWISGDDISMVRIAT